MQPYSVRSRFIAALGLAAALSCIAATLTHADPPKSPGATGAKSNKGADTRRKAGKAAVRKRPPRLVVTAAVFGSEAGSNDLTGRFQKAVQDDLLVVFVERALSDDKNRAAGDLLLRAELDGMTIEQKVPHRKFLYLDAREPGKIPPKGLAILDAWYGAGIWGEETMVDVRTQLSGKVSRNRLQSSVKDLVAGVKDPAPGVAKALILRIAIDGVPQPVVMFEEHQTVDTGAP